MSPHCRPQDFPLLRLDDVVDDQSNILGFSMLNSTHAFYLEFLRSLNLSWREGCSISPYPGPAVRPRTDTRTVGGRQSGVQRLVGVSFSQLNLKIVSEGAHLYHCVFNRDVKRELGGGVLTGSAGSTLVFRTSGCDRGVR